MSGIRTIGGPEIRDRTAKNAKMPRRELGRTTLEAVVVVPGTIQAIRNAE